MSPLKYKQCHELPPRTDLACEFSVSESTVSSAKRLPAAAKILTSLTRHPGLIAMLTRHPGLIAMLTRHPGLIAMLTRHPGLIAIRGAIAPENAIKPGWGWGWGWGLRG
jgi:hypothetical protein